VKKIQVLLVDDHEIVRLGLMTLINDQPDMEVIGETGTALDALRQVNRLHPDVVLMDIRMPGEGAIEITERIVQGPGNTQVVVLTSYADDQLLVRAIRAGAAGYILKQVGNEELLRAIRAAARKEAVLDPATTARLLNRVRETERQAEHDAFRELSDREMEVLVEVSRGKSNGEIGRVLNLSEKTVRNYVSTILEKLHLSNRIEMATYAVEHHLSDHIDRG